MDKDFWRNYSIPPHVFNKIDSPCDFNDGKDFFTDKGNKMDGLIVIFVAHVEPKITATTHPKAFTPAGAGDAFVTGTHSFARPADQTGD